MDTRDFRISRWVMIVEAIGCFGPLSLAWCLTTFGATGVLRYTPDIVSRDFAAFPGGTFIFTLFALGAVVGVVGPLGLYFGLRYAASGRGLARPLGFTLIGVLVAYELVAALGWLLGPPGYQPDATTALLFVLIPLLGLAHLMFLARPGRPLPGAGLAASWCRRRGPHETQVFRIGTRLWDAIAGALAIAPVKELPRDQQIGLLAAGHPDALQQGGRREDPLLARGQAFR